MMTVSVKFILYAEVVVITVDSLRKVNATCTLGHINALCAILVLQVLKIKRKSKMLPNECFPIWELM